MNLNTHDAGNEENVENSIPNSISHSEQLDIARKYDSIQAWATGDGAAFDKLSLAEVKKIGVAANMLPSSIEELEFDQIAQILIERGQTTARTLMVGPLWEFRPCKNPWTVMI